jgi:hypothetical protein
MGLIVSYSVLLRHYPNPPTRGNGGGVYINSLKQALATEAEKIILLSQKSLLTVSGNSFNSITRASGLTGTV